MSKTVVSIVKVNDVSESVKAAVELAGGMCIEEGDVVVFKPNAKNPCPPGYGVVTDARVVDALIALAVESGAKKVKIADGAAYPSGAYDTFAAFQAMGLVEVAKKWDAELVDLNSYDSLDLKVEDSQIFNWIRVGRSVIEADVVVNVPVLKTHTLTLLSACLKNIGVGCATREEKKRLHRLGLDEGIVDVYSLVRPRFNMVDGIVALEGDGPNLPPGKSKPLGLMISGKDGLAVDAVCAKIMGLNPNDIKHLQIAQQRGLGVLNLNQIEVKGEDIDEVTTKFEQPSTYKNP